MSDIAMHRLACTGLLLVALLHLLTTGSAGQDASQSPSVEAATISRVTDLDTLMARVLANRDQAWRRLQEYLLAERETFRLRGPDGARVFGLDREYLWVARDNRAVRSPVRINGVAVGDDDRRRAEADWEREEEGRSSREPRFISEVQFLRFRFEPGNYYFVGRETLAGRDVLRIEYYPRRLFSETSEGDGDRTKRRDPSKEQQAIEHAFNKVSLVTLWVDPAVDQVVRYTFENVDFTFLPGRSLVRVEAANATMTMGQPIAGVWLPESLVVEGAATLATGTYRAEYARRFSDYRQADVQVRFRVKDDK